MHVRGGTGRVAHIVQAIEKRDQIVTRALICRRGRHFKDRPIRNAGGFRLSDSWDWVFLVEEFDTPESAPPAPPEKGQPQPKKPPVQKGPKIET